MKNKKIYLLIAIATIFSICIIAGNIIIKRTDVWICSYTGSRKSSTTWLYLFTTNETYDKSPLEDWLEKKNKSIPHNWVNISNNEQRILSLTRGVTSSPPIHDFSYDLQKLYLIIATEKQVLFFLSTLKTEPEEKQVAIVNSIVKVCENAMSKYLSQQEAAKEHRKVKKLIRE